MRDPKRIDKIINQIRDIWKCNPDLRLMQLLCNCFTNDPYFVEDEAMLEKVKSTYTR